MVHVFFLSSRRRHTSCALVTGVQTCALPIYLYDIWILTKTFDFAPDRLARAIAATFARRQTAIPADRPDALTPAFAEDPLKQRQWAAFASDIDQIGRASCRDRVCQYV